MEDTDYKIVYLVVGASKKDNCAQTLFVYHSKELALKAVKTLQEQAKAYEGPKTQRPVILDYADYFYDVMEIMDANTI